MGKVRTIGVSNFNRQHLHEILSVAKIPPAVNQVELHPLLPQRNLLEFCETHAIHPVAYSPLGSGATPSLLANSTILQVAKDLGLTPAQVLLGWALTRGTTVIPKTSDPARLEENFDMHPLDAESMCKLNSIPSGYRFINPVDFWKHDCFVDE